MRVTPSSKQKEKKSKTTENYRKLFNTNRGMKFTSLFSQFPDFSDFF